jgi:hypothetical protein
MTAHGYSGGDFRWLRFSHCRIEKVTRSISAGNPDSIKVLRLNYRLLSVRLSDTSHIAAIYLSTDAFSQFTGVTRENQGNYALTRKE